MDDNQRWRHIDYLLQRESPLVAPGFEKDTPENPATRQFINIDARVLVIGAGGLGCELLKGLALSGFRNIDVIDMDTIDVSNLNRQFLFRQKDVGRPKAEVAAEFINKRIPGVNVVPHFCAIQDKPIEFYQQFQIIIAGLDSVKARRWINATLVSLVEKCEDSDEWDGDTVIPLIDGGTEAFKGQTRVILPRMTSCFECSLDLFPADPLNFQFCTIANTPRQPEHCIAYAYEVLWNEERPDIKLDKDNSEHMMWIFKKAEERAAKFKIPGVTFKLTQAVVKRIIPAVASTNAIIAASCVNEAFKIATRSGNYLDNYMMYNGTESVYTSTFNYEKKANCPVCGSEAVTWSISGDKTLEDLIQALMQEPKFQLSGPSVSTGTAEKKRILYMTNPKVLEQQTRPNLKKPLKELIESGDYLYLTDPSLPAASIDLRVEFV